MNLPLKIANVLDVMEEVWVMMILPKGELIFLTMAAVDVHVEEEHLSMAQPVDNILKNRNEF